MITYNDGLIKTHTHVAPIMTDTLVYLKWQNMFDIKRNKGVKWD